MTKLELLEILKNPASMSKSQTFELEDMIADYPYFQPLRALYLKGLKEQNSFRYNQTLKTTAVYTNDRSILFKFITSTEFENTNMFDSEKQIIAEIEGIDEKVFDTLQIESENNSEKKSEYETENEIDFINKNQAISELSDFENSDIQEVETAFESEIKEKTELIEKKETDINPLFDIDNLDDDQISDIINTLSIENELKENETNQDLLAESDANTDFFSQNRELQENSKDINEVENNEFYKNIISEESENLTLEEQDESIEKNDYLSNEKVKDDVFENVFHEENFIDEITKTAFDELIEENNSINELGHELPVIESDIRDQKLEEKEIFENNFLDTHYSEESNFNFEEESRKILTGGKVNLPEQIEDLIGDDFSYENIDASFSDEKSEAFLFYNAEIERNEKHDVPLDEISNEIKDKEDEIVFELIPEEISSYQEETEEPKSDNELKIEMSDEFKTPVSFKKDDLLSFQVWLQLSTFKPIDRKVEENLKITLNQKMELIDDFIVKNPKIEPIKEKIEIEKNEVKSFENETVMTETLARVYVLQHKYTEAIKAYEILSLKYPEKSSFFADQIKQIEILRNNF